MALLATLLPNHGWLARLRAGVRNRYTVVPCGGWGELLAVCASRPVAVAVVDLYSAGPLAHAFDALRQLRRRFPSVTVVKYVSAASTPPRDLFDLGRLGLDGLIIAEQDDEPHALLPLIEQAEARGVAELVRAALAELGDVKPTARDAALVAVTRAHERLSPAGLARVLGLKRKVLAERLARAALPSPQPLLAWGRLIVAARLLEDEERSADGVAMALEFPSGSAFRNCCQRYLGVTPHQIRAHGGARWVIGRMLEGRRVEKSAVALAS